jgi:hypothetical protein
MKSKIHILKKTIKIIVCKKILLLSASLFLSALVVQSQTTYDVFTYTEPTGYKKETKTNSVTYTKSDAKTGTYCIISLYAQSPSSGDLQKDFNKDWAALVVPMGVTNAPQKSPGEDMNGWKTYSGAANFEFNGGTSMVLLTTAKKENTNVAMLFMSNNSDIITKNADAFLATLKIGAPASISMATTKSTYPAATNNNKGSSKITEKKAGYSLNGNGIVGLWQILTYDYVNKNTTFKHQAFFANGQTIGTCPTNGFYNYNGGSDENVTILPYNFSNNKGMIISEQYGNSTLEKIDNNRLKIGTETYFKCQNVDAAKLSGTYGAVDYVEGNLCIDNGTKTIIHFNKNGTFTDEGFWAYVEGKGTKYKPENAPGKGTYEIKDFTIFLTYEDGHKKVVAFNFSLNTILQNHKMIFIDQSKLYKLN